MTTAYIYMHDIYHVQYMHNIHIHICIIAKELIQHNSLLLKQHYVDFKSFL